MKRIIRRYELTDAEWERLRPYFPERQMGEKGRTRREPRQMLNGIFWIARSGAAWRDLPERYGTYSTVYKRFREWSESTYTKCEFREFITNHGADYCIPPTSNISDPWLSIGGCTRNATLWRPSSSSSRSSAVPPCVMTSSPRASSPSFIWIVFAYSLHNLGRYAF